MSPRDIIPNPAWFPHRLIEKSGPPSILFAHLPRSKHREVTFLDDQYLGSYQRTVLPFEAVGGLETQPVHFIFHSAFCCSTLMARMFDIDGISMGLKEPAILNDLAARSRKGEIVGPLLSSTLALLSRPFSVSEKIIVKPSNLANDLIPEMLRASPKSRALLLYAPLRVFLRSIAKKGMWGRIWVRRYYTTLQTKLPFDPGYSSQDLFSQTDLQVAALAWLQQQMRFAKLVGQYPDRIRTLNSEWFLQLKLETIKAAARHFNLNFTDLHISRLLESTVFTSHSKSLGRDYDTSDRADEAEAIERLFGDEIDMVENWARVLMQQFRVPEDLPLQLVAF